MPDDLILIDVKTDSWYQDYYVNRFSPPGRNGGEAFIRLHLGDNWVVIHKALIFSDSQRASPLLKSAQFALASYAKDEKYCIHTHRYLAEFHRRANDTLHDGELREDLVHALYLIVLFSLISRESSAAIQVNSLQLARAVNILLHDADRILDEYHITIERMWNTVIGILFSLRGVYFWDPKTRPELEADNCTLVEHSRQLLPKDIKMWALSHSNEKQMFIKLGTLTNILAAQLNRFHFHLTNQDVVADEGLIAELRNEIDCAMEQVLQLCTLMPHVPGPIRQAVSFGLKWSSSRNIGSGIEDFDFGDLVSKAEACLSPTKYRYWALCYCLISLAQALIISSIDLNDMSTSGVVGWAFAICYLSESLWKYEGGTGQVVVHGLLWAGIILTKPRCPTGGLPLTV
jgi:hypothetical protein